MKKKAAIFTISLLSAAVIALGVLAKTHYDRAESYRQYMSANYQHAFAELVTSVSQIDTALEKSRYATSPALVSAICTQIFGEAMTAQMTLGVLPFSTTELEQTAGFISRVGDYTYTLSRSAAGTGGCTPEQRESLSALSDTAAILAQNLIQLQADMAEGVLTMDELLQSEGQLDRAEGEDSPVTLSSRMRLMEGEFPEMPTLIYDGPFSQHLVHSAPQLLAGTEQCTEKEARKIAADFLNMQEGRVFLTAVSQGEVPAYYLSARTGDGELHVEVSVQGGRVISLTGLRETGVPALSDEEAVQAARRFLERRGYKNMRESYFIKNDGVMTVNFAWEQDGVLCYSDLVKVSVAMDSGSVVGFEAMGYLMNHRQRQLPAVEISPEQAQAQITADLQLNGQQLTLIPTDGGRELLCYEMLCGAAEDRNYIIYVNAVTGEQEKILILLEDENGSLTL